MTPLLTLTILALLAVMLWRLWPAPLALLFRALDRRHGRIRSCRMSSGAIDWHVLEGGHGENLVLLHGFNADGDHFNRVARHLSRHFRILAPDLPGFGETRVEGPIDYRISAQADRVLNWMDQAGIQRCYLGGSSMGGYIATEIARKAPERVRALWLLAPGGVLEAPHSPLFQEIAEERHNPLVIRNLHDFRRLIDYCFVHPPWIPGPLMRYLARRAAERTVDHQRAFDAIRFDSEPLETIAADLATPALIVWGRSDQVLHAGGASVLERVMPDAEVLLLPDTGHLPMLENPCTVAEAWISYTEARARDQRET